MVTSSASDLPLAGLVATSEEADNPPFRTSLDEVTEWLIGSWKDLSLDTLGGFDPAYRGRRRRAAALRGRWLHAAPGGT